MDDRSDQGLRGANGVGWRANGATRVPFHLFLPTKPKVWLRGPKRPERRKVSPTPTSDLITNFDYCT